MKKLLIALAAAATAVVASAEITNQLDFEGADGTAYANDAPSVAANYPFASFGFKYLELEDLEDEESYKPDVNSGTVFDMYVQFTPMTETETPTVDEGAKIAVYVDNSENKLVHVISGGTDYTTGASVKGEWVRLTIVEVATGYQVYVNGGSPILGAVEGSEDSISVFPATTGATTVEFTGSGKLDNFVARTTNPFGGTPTGWIAKDEDASDPEQYYTDYTAALTAALNGASLTFNGETEMDGTAAHPFEIRSVADLKALQAAVADGNGADKCYVQTADIALTEAWPGIGVQNGKDLVSYTVGTASGNITQEEADRRDAKWSAGAFKGTYDGGNYTISNFQMVGVAGNPDSTTEGLDYCGFFNSVDGATIKNLKIAYAGSLFATDTTASTKESGATFVGVAKNSTLQNLTSLQKDAETAVSCSKGFGGIVGYTTSGTTVDSCTNNVNMTSLANNKCGGIAMITQTGAAVTIRNCQNNGTTAGKATERGGIVGYVSVATTIDGCSDTAGSTPSILHNQGQTVTVSGVITAPAGVLSYTTSNNNAIDGLDFATVDNDVATFVKAADLVDNGEYVVMGPKAAYAFTQAGTISFDQSLAATTVTADRSKFVFTTSEPVDNVTTYTAVAGVASVGGQAYATLQDAIDNAGDNDVITILPGIDTTQRYNVFNRGGTFKFAYDTDYIALFMNGLLTADGFILQGMPVTESEDTVLVYSVVEGVAKMNSTWYASFESAYYAAPGSGATLLVKVDSDFTPTFPQASQNEVLKEFASVTFTTTSEEPIAIATSDGTTFIKSQNWSAPETATLTLASQTIASVATGTLNIPEGTTLAVASGASFANVGAITGAGVLSAVGLNPVTALQTDHVAALLADSAKWTGVVVLGNVSLGNDSLDYYGNVNSTVRLSNVDVNSLVIAGRSNNVKSLDVAGNGLTFNELAANTTIPCALTGDGSIVVKGSAAQQKVLSFTGDCSEFAGSLTIDNANGVAKVLFGTKDTVGNGSCLTVGSDASVKVASGKTWTVPGGYVINGSVKADGALNTADKIYGSGTITSTVAQTSKVGGSWSGTYNICWAGNHNTGISFDWYGQANSKIVIPANHTLQGFIAVTANQSLTLAAGEFVVDGVLNLSNGYDYSTVGWKKISGSGTLKFAFAPSHWIKEKIEKLDGFTGSIEVSTTTQLEIAGVRVAAAPEAGARVVPITVNGSGTVGGDLKLYVGDEVQDVTLEFKADGAEGSGLYVAEPPAAKVAEIVDGEQYETLAEALAAATDGATVKLLANIAVTEMQLVTKAVTLDLAGFAITAGERSAEAATAGDDSILCVLHGGSLTINDSSAGGTGAITGNSVFTTGVKMTKKGDTDDTKKATLVVNGGTITGYYYGIAGNGLTGRGNTEVTINGGTIKGTRANDCVAIFQPQLGTLTINGGYLEGAMGVYVKSGTATVAINGGTIKGNGTYAAYVHSTNGFNNTGDAFVVDNAGYPGGAPAPSILGGTFVSVNASAIASYAKTGLERIVHFADKDAVTITEAKASSEDVFLEKGFPGGSDDKTFTIDTAVQAALAEKIPEGKALTDPVEGTTSGVTYAQAYALGLLDETTGELKKDVTPTISIVNGKVVVSLDGTTVDSTRYTVMLNVFEKASLDEAQWPETPAQRYELGSEDEAAGFTPSDAAAGFYKVGVTIEDAPSGN